MLVMLLAQCTAAQAAKFTTWNKGTILTDPITYFGSDRYRFTYAKDDTGASFSWNWVAYMFSSKGKNTQSQDGYEYAKKLEATGFFEIIEETSEKDRWEMRYIGKDKKFKAAKSGDTQFKWHVLILANAGTNNEFRVLLVDGFRFDALDPDGPAVKPTAKPTKKPTPKPTKKPVSSCDVCGGTRKCPDCGGDNWVTRWKWVYVKGSPESRQVTEICNGRWCYGGACLKCHDD